MAERVNMVLRGDALRPYSPPKKGAALAVRSIRGKDEWLTPPDILQALGSFDLDPCAPVERPWDMAARHFTVLDNGLEQDWQGRVWLNPPYGTETGEWMQRLVRHGDGIALILARTDTVWFHKHVWGGATVAGLLFLKGRISFFHSDGSQSKRNVGAPSVLVAYGRENGERLRACGLKGAFVPRNAAPAAHL